MTQKNTFSNEKMIHLLFMWMVFAFVFTAFLLSMDFLDRKIMLSVLGIMLLIIIRLLCFRVVSVEISTQRIDYSNQFLFCQLIGLQAEKGMVEYNYLHKFEITHSMPASLIILFIQKNGSFCYKRIPLIFFSKKSIETVQVKIMHQQEWGLGV